MNETRLPLKWRLEGGKLSFENAGDSLLAFKNLSGSVVLDDEQYLLEDAEEAPAAPVPAGEAREEFLFKNGIRWIREVKGDGNCAEVTVTLRNESKSPVTVGPCSVLHGSFEQGFRADLGDDPDRILQLCWNPWYTTVRHIREEKGDSCFFVKHHPNGTNSGTLCHLSDRKTKRTLLLSFITLDRMRSSHPIFWNTEKNCIGEYSAVCHASGLLNPGGELAMETLRIEYFSDPYRALEFWADDVYQRYKPDFSGTCGVVVGCGWDRFVWEDRVREVMDFCDTKMAGFNLKLIGGNNHHTMKDSLPGHWMEFKNDSKGRNYEAFYREAAKKGWRFKFWFSPFWFFEDAKETFEENEGNLFKGPDGKPLRREWPGGWELSTKYAEGTLGRYYFDGTHPKTAAYLKKVFSFYRELGVRAYMMDFLEPACGPGCTDPTLQRREVMDKVFGALREAAGRDTGFQTAVGSGPNYIGLINSARVTRDFGETRPQYPFSNWQNAAYCMHDDHFANIDSFMQNASAVWFTNGKTYVNDLNVFTIDKPVPLEFARMVTTMFGLSGDSPVTLHDYLPGMDPERLRMLKSILPRTGGIPVPVDLFDRPTVEGGCHILKKPIRTPWENYMLTAVFNSRPNTPAFETEVEFARLGLDPEKAYRVFEFWNGEYVGTYRKSFPVSIPAVICRLYRISEARPYPWILGTDMHIEQGNADLQEVAWDPETLTLSGKAIRPKGESGRIYFTIPLNLYLDLAGCTHIMTMKEVFDMQTVAVLPVSFDKSDCVEFKLEFKVKDTDVIAHRGWFDFTTESGWREYLKSHPLPGNRVTE